MEFNESEKDIIHNYWVDISQDPSWISEDSGIDYQKVMGILRLLSKEGKIKNFNEDEIGRIRKFNEMINPSDLKSFKTGSAVRNKMDVDDYFGLELDKLNKSDTDYFFDDEVINRSWADFPLNIKVVRKRLGIRDMNEKIIGFQLDITFTNRIGKSEEFSLAMFYQRDTSVSFSNRVSEFSSRPGFKRYKEIKLSEFFDKIGGTEKIYKLTSNIIDDLVPDDFWEVHDKQN